MSIISTFRCVWQNRALDLTFVYVSEAPSESQNHLGFVMGMPERILGPLMHACLIYYLRASMRRSASAKSAIDVGHHRNHAAGDQREILQVKKHRQLLVTYIRHA